MAAYYNEINKFAAEWLRNLITAGHIAPGEVDERSIEDVTPADLKGFTQCHFFAGVGVWSYALRRAGVSDNEPLWTGSCPCQPFSAAGKGNGFADERHLWPAFHYLIEQCRPPIVVGEQVASKDAEPWIDLVQDDLEAMGYTFGAVPFPAASVGAPHIRDRLYWVADADQQQRDGGGNARQAGRGELANIGAACGLDHAHHQGLEGFGNGYQAEVEWWRAFRSATEAGESGGLAYADGRNTSAEREQCGGQQRQQPQDGGCGVVASGGLAEAGEFGGVANTAGARRESKLAQSGVYGGFELECVGGLGEGAGPETPAGPTNGYWRNADWLFCRDGKWRPVMPGSFPLVNGAPARVGRLRAFGNAINAAQAEIFIRCVMECRP